MSVYTISLIYSSFLSLSILGIWGSLGWGMGVAVLRQVPIGYLHTQSHVLLCIFSKTDNKRYLVIRFTQFSPTIWIESERITKGCKFASKGLKPLF